MDLFGNRPLPQRSPGFKGFNQYAAGKKRYGAGRLMPNIGPVRDMFGYRERDNKAKARKNAILRRMKGQQSGNPLNPNIARSDARGGF